MLTSELIVTAVLVFIPAFWWLISWLSVTCFLAPRVQVAFTGKVEPLTLFKPIPPLRNDEERQRYADSIESFSKQMLNEDEILIRCEKEGELFWREKASDWERASPGLVVRVFVSLPENQLNHTNPKINAMAALAPHAARELWWWSDADITVPQGEVDRIRSEVAQSPVALQTQAYVIPRICRVEDWLDAMFVHVELLPGLTLLSGKKSVNFACGGSLLFRKEHFEKKVDWEELGAELADDYFLGQKMQPVRLGRSLMQTQSGELGIISSWLHYFRWQKTVRWCQPAGFAGLFFLQPVWLALVAWCCHVPGPMVLGLIIFLLILEAIWVHLLFRKLRILTPYSVFWVSPLWSVVRSATWLLCWFPLAVSWSGIKWWKSKARSVSS
jgi:ceramide glucosyltransferase